MCLTGTLALVAHFFPSWKRKREWNQNRPFFFLINIICITSDVRMPYLVLKHYQAGCISTGLDISLSCHWLSVCDWQICHLMNDLHLIFPMFFCFSCALSFCRHLSAISRSISHQYHAWCKVLKTQFELCKWCQGSWCHVRLLYIRIIIVTYI